MTEPTQETAQHALEPSEAQDVPFAMVTVEAQARVILSLVDLLPRGMALEDVRVVVLHGTSGALLGRSLVSRSLAHAATGPATGDAVALVPRLIAADLLDADGREEFHRQVRRRAERGEVRVVYLGRGAATLSISLETLRSQVHKEQS